jgi:hypothetical protein
MNYFPLRFLVELLNAWAGGWRMKAIDCLIKEWDDMNKDRRAFLAQLQALTPVAIALLTGADPADVLLRAECDVEPQDLLAALDILHKFDPEWDELSIGGTQVRSLEFGGHVFSWTERDPIPWRAVIEAIKQVLGGV